MITIRKETNKPDFPTSKEKNKVVFSLILFFTNYLKPNQTANPTPPPPLPTRMGFSVMGKIAEEGGRGAGRAIEREVVFLVNFYLKIYIYIFVFGIK